MDNMKNDNEVYAFVEMVESLINTMGTTIYRMYAAELVTLSYLEAVKSGEEVDSAFAEKLLKSSMQTAIKNDLVDPEAVEKQIEEVYDEVKKNINELN